MSGLTSHGEEPMDEHLAVIFFTLAGVVVMASAHIYRRKGRKRMKLLLTFVLIAALPLTWHMTTIKTNWNENTFAYGWPIPRVVFQRSAPGERWDDFVGPTLFLAYPMNYILYTIFPVGMLWALTVLADRRRDKIVSRDS